MTSENFAYWLQGFFEITGATEEEGIILNKKQVKMIQSHLNMVFVHEIDPKLGDEEHQQNLSNMHEGMPRDADRPANRRPFNSGTRMKC